MIPIAGYPSVVSSVLPVFSTVFNKPQLRNFGAYVTGVMVSPNRTVSYMNSLFFAHRDQSALNHFITDSNWSDEELDEKRYEIVQEGLRDEEGEGVLEIDDTLTHKTGKHMELAGMFFDHADGTYTLAHDLVSSHITRGRRSVPLDFEIYAKEGQVPEGQQFRDKNTIARDLISKAHAKGVPFSCVTGDSWFFNKETVSLIQSLKKDWVFGCKSNRLVLLKDGWTNVSEWARTVPKEKFKPVEVRYRREKRTFYCYNKDLVMKNLGRVNVLVSYRKPDLSGDPVFLCTNRCDWDAVRIARTYAKRWCIDAFYRDAKQSLGLEDYELRKVKGVKRHITMVFIAHTLLEMGSGLSSQSKPGIEAAKAGACLDTIGSKCRHASTEILTSFVDLVLKIGEKVHGDAAKIASIVLSPRSMLPAGFAKV